MKSKVLKVTEYLGVSLNLFGATSPTGTFRLAGSVPTNTQLRGHAVLLRKVLESAIANAEHNDGADIDELKVSAIWVNQGPTQKRMRARAKGRGNRILKRSSHITVTVADS